MTTEGRTPAPKDPQRNCAYRRIIIERARDNAELQREIWQRCKYDFVYFCDTFLYTYDPKNHKKHPHRPFILWDYQEKTSKKIIDATGNHSLLAEKSRQMGFTWIVMAVRLWFWIFWPGLSFLLGSRKEEFVDSPGNPACLFYKLDYMLQRLPGWMQPSSTRTDRRLKNEDNDSVIVGESTNDNFGRGGTYTAIDLDEFSAVENGHRILEAVGDATNSTLYFGTSQGASGAYYDMLQTMRKEAPEHIVRWFWTDHPEKRHGLYTSIEQPDSSFQLKKLAPESEYPADYNFILDGKLRSLAYDRRDRNCPNKKIMAREWGIEYFASSDQWFDQQLLDRLKSEMGRDPTYTGEIILDPDWKHPKWHRRPGGRLQLFFKWDNPESPGMIPKEWNDIVCGCDISMGTAGEYSSNSVATFFRTTTGEKIAQLTANNLSPTEFCRYVLALCRWFNDAYLAWETNGPGVLFTTTVRDEGYRNVYMSEDNEQKFVQKKTFKPGFHSTKDSKKSLLTEYSEALIDGHYTNPCREAIDECGQYILLPTGHVEHARSKSTDDPSATGESHGDMVIADALSWRAARDILKRQLPKENEKPPLPYNSYGARRERYLESQDTKKQHWGDFSHSSF